MHQLKKGTYTILKPGEPKFLTENSQFGFFTAILRFLRFQPAAFYRLEVPFLDSLFQKVLLHNYRRQSSELFS